MTDTARDTSYGTGFQRTTIESTSDGRFRWTRTPGVDNRDGFRVPPPGLAARFAGMADGGATFLAPAAADPRRVVWEADGDTSFAAVVQAEPGGDRAMHGARQLGRALRAFHRSPGLDAQPDPTPPALRRFHDWLRTGEGTRASRPWRVHLRSRLGPQRWESLLRATDALVAGSGSTPTTGAAVHGWMSLGNVVTADGASGRRGSSLQVLTGNDLAARCPEFDVGCLLGELAEFALRAELFDRDPAPFHELSGALLTGYGEELDAGLLAAARAVRVALHSADFAAYLGWHSDLELYPAMVDALLDAVPVGSG